MEAKLKHLELIQGVVNRLASASFRMKGWSVVLVSALLVLGAQVGSVELGIVALVPVLVFWGLDGYFLSQESLFRKLFNAVRKRKEEDIDFSMSVQGLRSEGRFWTGDWLSAVRSRTLWPFYVMLALLALASVFIQPLGSGR